MKNIELIATSAFGLESVLKSEVINLGFDIVSVENGKVTYKSDLKGIAVSNLHLRTADRVLIKVGEFKATSFEELFEKTKALPWEQWIPSDGNFPVDGSSVKSKLFSISDSQAIVKKAIVEKLKQTHDLEWFSETGSLYKVKVSLLKDIATLTIDTSGAGLHKRGYRALATGAPIKETLAAAMILLSYWDKTRVLLDPFCGSGTIPIEAALIGRNIAPGLNRSFASEEWTIFDDTTWKQARVEAFKQIDYDADLKIYGSDIDQKAIDIAIENSIEAGVDDCIEFTRENFYNISIKEPYGVLITNPPYGERLSHTSEIKRLYTHMGALFYDLEGWSKYVVTSFEHFEKHYGKKADKKRKLYNGTLKVDYYQYYGKRPPKES